ncbi:5'-nucleotidase C-terminal domain-containing protein [Helicovermis profundi]
MLVLVMGLSFSVSFADTSNDISLTILQTSDMHGRIYPHDYATDSADSDAGYAKIFTLIKEQRALDPDSLLIDNGDTVQDNSAELFNDLPVHPMVQAMNTMGYDIWVPGNHEFNFDMDFLNRNLAAFKGDVVVSNVYKKGTTERWQMPYKIVDMKGVRVAVVGMLPPNIPLWEASSPSHFAGLEFTDTLAETGKVLKELEGKYDVLIGAYHVGPTGEHGYEGTEEIANAYPQFDVIFSGHAHSKYNKVINGVHIIEPGKYGWALAKAEIKVNKDTKKVDVVETTNIETKKMDADKTILDEFKFVDDKSLADANTVVGTIGSDFIAKPDYITGSSDITTMPTAQVEDTSIIDLINNVQMFYAKSDISSAALFNFGSNLKKGPFLKKDVAYIYKYPNTLVGVNISGENLLKYMEWSANYYNTYKKGDIEPSFNPKVRGYNYDMFSGVTYDIDLSKEAGHRIENVMYKGKALDPKATYKLSINNYRFGTLIGLGLVTMDDKYYDSYSQMQDKGRIRDLIIKYTLEEKGGKIDPTVDNNWKITGVDYNMPMKDTVLNLVKEGKVKIPTSEDGRTKNIKSLNVYDLLKENMLPVKSYTIKSGDMLWKISKANGYDWKDASVLNNLANPNMIYPGEVLYFPAK